MPAAPDTIVRTSPSWPGTSTTPSRVPSGRSSGAKPSSIVIPRAFSSGSRSVSTPVSARHERGLAVVDVARGAEDQRDGRRALAAARPSRGPMRSKPVYARRASGIAIEPSACWWFSSSAISARAIATAVPFSVWTSSFFLLPLRRKRVLQAARLEVGAVRGAGHLAPVAALAAPGQPRLDVELAVGGRAEVARGDVDHAVRHARAPRTSAPRSAAAPRASPRSPPGA